MSMTTRSGAGAFLQAHQVLGKPYTPKANSTINQDLRIQEALTPSDSDVFAMKAYVIGNKGHRTEIGTNNIALTLSNLRQPSNAGLFGLLPQVMRLPENDLSTLQRQSYYLRRLEEHNGVTYVCYYAKKLDLDDTAPKMEFRDSDTGNATDFEYTLDDLRPMPTAIPSGMAVTASGQYIVVTAKVDIVFTEFDIEELLNVSRIIYNGNDAYAIISEIGLVHGVERRISIDVSGSSVPFEELICAQIGHFVASHIAVKFLNSGHKITLDVGATEPMAKLVPAI